MKYIGIDIGGTWIKGTLVDNHSFDWKNKIAIESLDVKKVKSPLNENTKVSEVMDALTGLISLLDVNLENIKGIGISTPGIVDYHGSRLLNTGPHLRILKNAAWKNKLKTKFQCPVSLINDADAAAIGLAELGGYLEGNKTIGIMPIGTGIGFSIWRNGRRWRPGKTLPLLGSINFVDMEYNKIASASRLAERDSENNLLNVLSNPKYRKERNLYIKNLVAIIKTAFILYSLDEVILCGGLVDAANECDYDIEKEINEYFDEQQPVAGAIKVKVAKEGNKLQLIGNLSLAQGELTAAKSKVTYQYDLLETEAPYKPEFRLEEMKSLEIINMLWKAEQEAGTRLEDSLTLISKIVDECIAGLRNGGRIIYIGAGTSGRIAAMDAVEIPCTYGFPDNRIISLIAGGMSEAAMEIESDFEEDASAVPEMLLLDINANDVVIGISASGTAYYVQSALALAKAKKALTVMIQSKVPNRKLIFSDYVVPLGSGSELIRGSTRMKAGTATKKVLNFFSSALMVKLGKVKGSYMIDVICTNDKLIERAQNILKELYDIEENEAMERLEKAEMHLGKVIKSLS